jgi:hypothetical protein
VAVQAMPDEARRRLLEHVAELARERIALVRDTPEYKAEVKRRIIASFHDEQRRVWESIVEGQRYITMCCSRRGGKTWFNPRLTVLLLLNAQFMQEVVYVAPTLKRGKELIWRELMSVMDAYHLGWKTRENEGTVTTGNGAFFRIVGLDDKSQVDKVSRGGNTLAFLSDEAQIYSHLLMTFADAASPALAQSRGLFIVCGTPGYIKRGYWHDICHGGDGYINFHWTMHANPHLGRPADDIIAEEMARKGWGADHPTLLREYFGLWVDDFTRLVCELNDARNVVGEVPEYDPLRWRHFLGVDYGNSPDPCAWVVAAAHPHKNYVAILHSEKATRLTSDQIADKTNELRVRFNCKRIVGDSASGGKTFFQDFNDRYARAAGFTMVGAEKHDKPGSIDMLNTELRTGRLVILKSGAQCLVDELKELQWNEERTEFLPGADHCFDSLRYALRSLRAHTAKPEPKTERDPELERIIERNKRNAARV